MDCRTAGIFQSAVSTAKIKPKIFYTVEHVENVLLQPEPQLFLDYI